MYLHVDDINSQDYDVIDLDTNKRISRCQWANDKSGQYNICLINKDGSLMFDDLGLVTVVKKGNIKLRKK